MMQTALVGSALWAAEAPVSSPAGSDWVSYLLNGGPFAIILLLFVMDKLGTHSERDRLRIQVGDKDKQIDILQQEIRTQIVPPLTEMTRLMTEVLRHLDEEDWSRRRHPPRDPS